MERERGHEASPTRLALDTRFAYRGYHTEGGICRIRIYDRPAASPVVIATELPENRNSSITNLCEYLWWEVGRVYLPQYLEMEHPYHWIEHYPGERFHPVPSRREDTYTLAEFEDYRPRVVWLGGQQRVRIGQPAWKHLSGEQVEALIGMRPDPAQDESR